MTMIIDRPLNGGNQKVYKFENGYGASVISGGTYTYGGDEGLQELAVLKFYGTDEYELCYDTEITGDVLGYLSSQEVEALLKQIEELV
jgi:hypothetical protein